VIEIRDLLSDRQIRHVSDTFFGFLNHKFVGVVLDASGRVAACGIAMPSLSRASQKCRGRLCRFGVVAELRALPRNDRVDVRLVSVRPELQNCGATAILIKEIWTACHRLGIRYAETESELESNQKVHSMWRHVSARQRRRQRCVVKAL
jgi:hypothetical protein